jgi:hypothetical protein
LKIKVKNRREGMIPRKKNQFDGNKGFLIILLEPLSSEKEV